MVPSGAQGAQGGQGGQGVGTLEGSGFHPQGPASTCRLSKMPLTIRIRITAVGLLLSPLLSVGIALGDRRVDLDRVETVDSGSEVVAHRERESRRPPEQRWCWTTQTLVKTMRSFLPPSNVG